MTRGPDPNTKSSPMGSKSSAGRADDMKTTTDKSTTMTTPVFTDLNLEKKILKVLRERSKSGLEFSSVPAAVTN